MRLSPRISGQLCSDVSRESVGGRHGHCCGLLGLWACGMYKCIKSPRWRWIFYGYLLFGDSTIWMLVQSSRLKHYRSFAHRFPFSFFSFSVAFLSKTNLHLLPVTWLSVYICSWHVSHALTHTRILPSSQASLDQDYWLSSSSGFRYLQTCHPSLLIIQLYASEKKHANRVTMPLPSATSSSARARDIPSSFPTIHTRLFL